MNKIKKSLLILGIQLTAICSQAVLTQTFDYTSQSGGGYAIEDGNPVGNVFTGNFNQAPSGAIITGVTVNLTVSGGYNGDLYAYLVAPNGTMVVLLNQPGADGFGSPASGFNNITLTGYSGNTYTSIQDVDGTYGLPLTGIYRADGNLDNFGTSGSPGGLANGTWQLYFADLSSSSSGTSILNSWTLNITAVPEPVTLALGCFGAMLLALAGVKWAWRKE
jgi:subtilisin-like proprotein convertase family protein